MNPEIELKIEDLYHTYENNNEVFISLKGINLTIYKNSITLLYGPNGAGKTTLLNIIKGNLEPLSGKVIKRVDFPNQIGFLDQFSYLNFNNVSNSLIEIINLFLNEPLIVGKYPFYRNHELLKLDTLINSRLNTLSIGEIQRLCLLITYISSVELIILDEPTAQLDSNSVAIIIEWLEKIKQKKTFLIATHDRRIEEIADSIYTISGGYIEEKEVQDDGLKIKMDVSRISGGAIKVPEFIWKYWGSPSKIHGEFSINDKSFVLNHKVDPNFVEKSFNYQIIQPNVINPSIQIKNCFIQTPEGRILGVPRDLTADAGDFVCLIGPSGSGKSTFISFILGSLPKKFTFSGTISKNKNYSSNIAFIQQKTPLVENLTLEEHLNWAIQGNLNIFYEIMNFLDFKIDLKRKISNYSGGQKQIISIGIILAKNPLIFVFDESLAFIDMERKEKILKLFEYLIKIKRIIIISTHEDLIIRYSTKQYYFS